MRTPQRLLSPTAREFWARTRATIKKRFDSIKIPSTEENRRDYRDMLFSTPEAGKYISGVILYDETIQQTRRPFDS